MENNKLYTSELSDVLTYMIDVLGNEFPTDVYGVEYLVVSILDDKKCHANLILNNCMMTSKFNDLKRYYNNKLRENCSLKPIVIEKKEGVANFNEELQVILNNAEIENAFIGGNKTIGSEHVLLSLLNNSDTSKNTRNIFKKWGVDYNFILNRCMNKQENEIKNQIINDPITSWVKSKINTKAVSNKTDYINNYTINLNSLVKEGKIDSLIGREQQIDMIIKVLARRKKNNVILVGNGGVGKTSIVNGIAEKIVKNEVPSILQDKEIVILNSMALVSGTHFRGMMEERVKGLFDELKANKNYILFLDDIQQVIKTSTKEKDTDLSSMIGDILAEGEVRVIATTTFKDYKNGIEINTALSRKLQKIIIEPNTKEEAVQILLANKHYYEEYHNVSFSQEVIEKAVELAERYITDRSLPDSAIDVLDLSGAYTCTINKEPQSVTEARHELTIMNNQKESLLNSGDFEKVDEIATQEAILKKVISDFEREVDKDKSKYRVEITVNDIARSVSDMTNIPISKLNADEKEKIANIEDILKQSIVGQDEAIEGVCRIIKRNKVGLGNKKRVLGALLMIGPSGVGKTLIAKKLAEEIFGSERDLIRIDMSEYSEKNSVAKLTGAAPGYIGYENGGQLTEAIKNKQHCVLLLDEIEKADQEVYNLFLQLFDEGRLTDSSGQIVNFKNVIVLMTSNIGAKQASEFGKGSGFITDEGANKKAIIEKQLKKTFTPEFINRIDQIVYFNPLTDDNLKNVVVLELNKFAQRLNEIGFNIQWDDEVINYIHSLALKQKEYGARPIIRLIQDNLEDDITDLILVHNYENGYTFRATVENEKIIIN